jgi:hypothetical protein
MCARTKRTKAPRASQRGSTLAWALVVVFVLAITLATSLLVASRGFSQEARRHAGDQAYYTALSLTKGFAEWVQSGDDDTVPTAERDEVAAFISGLKSASGGTVTLDFPAGQGLPDQMGSATVAFTFVANDVSQTGESRERITIATTASFADAEQTVSLDLYNIPSGVVFPIAHTELAATDYRATVTAINAGSGAYARDAAPINVFWNQGTASYTVKTGSGSATTNGSLSAGSSGSYPETAYAAKRNFNNENDLYVRGYGNTANSFSPPIAIPTVRPGSGDKGGYLINALAGTPITSASVTSREVTWYETIGSTGSRATGVADTPSIDGSRRSKTVGQTTNKDLYTNLSASNRLVTPLNGKFVINPINKSSGASCSHASNTDYNSMYACYNIDDTAGKDVYLRLANAPGTSQRTSGVPLFSYIGIDFTDNETRGLADMQLVSVPGITEQAVNIAETNNIYQNNGITKQDVAGVPFYPNKWNSATIYTTDVASEAIDSELVFGNYARLRSYGSGGIFDYQGWGNYVNHHAGAPGQNYETLSLLPRINSSTLADAKGLAGYPYPPVYWGNGFSMYLLDGAATTQDARIMQGVNIVNAKAADGSAGGVIYSTRGLKIGGALVARGGDLWGNGEYYDGVASETDGFDGSMSYAISTRYQQTYHQAIKDTDIVLVSPNGTQKFSEICHPDSIKGFPGRTLTIEGGSIYVGANCTLQIDSEVQDGLTVNRKIAADGVTGFAKWGTSNTNATDFYAGNSYVEQGNRMYVKPDKIVVDGGTLVILGNKNNHINVETDVYVKNGGTLRIEPGAKIMGNIYCYGGGTVDVRGSFTLIGRQTTVAGCAFEGGIFVYGETTADPSTGALLGAGALRVAANTKITGSIDGGMTPLAPGTQAGGSGRAVHFLSTTLFAGAAYEPYACFDHTPQNACKNVSVGGSGGWYLGVYS